MALPVPEDLAVGSEQQVDHETNDFSGREVVAGSLVRCFVEAPDQVLEDQAHVVIGNRDGMQVDIAEHFDNEVEPIARRAWRSPSRTRSTRISAGPWTRSLGMLIGLYWASINRLSLCLSSGGSQLSRSCLGWFAAGRASPRAEGSGDAWDLELRRVRVGRLVAGKVCCRNTSAELFFVRQRVINSADQIT
jgi:hypothetical protein